MELNREAGGKVRAVGWPLVIGRLVLAGAMILPVDRLPGQQPVVPDTAARRVSPRDTVPRDSAQRIQALEIVEARSTHFVGGAAAVSVVVDSARLRVAPTLADVLRTMPQVHTRTNSRGEVELSIRGGESRQATVTLNGLPLSPSWDGRADASLLPLSGVTSVTIERSSGSILGGPNAIGGIVDVRVSAPVTPVERQMQIGSDQTGARLLGASVGGIQGLGARGLVHWRAGGGLRAIDGVVRPPSVPDPNPDAAVRTNTDVSSRDLFFAGGWHATNGAALHALYSAYAAERGVPPELHLTAPRRWRYPAQSRGMLQVRATAAPYASRAGTTHAELSLGVLNGLTRIETFGDDRFTVPTGREAGDERVRTFRGTVTHEWSRGGELRAALTVHDIAFDEALAIGGLDHYAQRLASAGIEAQHLLGDRVVAVAGLVVDQGETRAAAGRARAPGGSAIGWRLGGTTELGEGMRLHASASHRARFPALRELYSGALNRFEPNPNLTPERLTTFESGIEWGAGADQRGGRANVVGFHHRLDDAVVRVGFPGTDRFIRINRDRTAATGLELTAGWRREAGGSVSADLVAQHIRVTDPRSGGSGRKPEHQPAIRAGLDLTHPLPWQLQLGGRVQFRGPQYCVHPERDRDVALAAQTMTGATLERRWRGLRLLLGVDNLANAAVYEQCGLPAPGRTVHLGVTLGFFDA